MALQDSEALIIEVDTAANSLPDPTTVPQRTHDLANTGIAACVWSSTGATPFTENAVNVATISVAPGSVKRVQSDGVHWVTVPANTLGAPVLGLPVVSTPVRVLNTTFTPNATRPVLGIYSVQITCSAALLAGQAGRIDLKADLGVPATIRTSTRNSLIPGLLTALGDTTVQRTELTFLFPAGWSGQLTSTAETGSPAFVIVAQTEITL